MRFSDIEPIVTTLKVDRRAVRNALRVLRNPNNDTGKKWTAIGMAIPNADVLQYLDDMKYTSRKSWSQVANRIESILLAA